MVILWIFGGERGCEVTALGWEMGCSFGAGQKVYEVWAFHFGKIDYNRKRSCGEVFWGKVFLLKILLGEGFWWKALVWGERIILFGKEWKL